MVAHGWAPADVEKYVYPSAQLSSGPPLHVAVAVPPFTRIVLPVKLEQPQPWIGWLVR
jgi:hypothetical protein